MKQIIISSIIFCLCVLLVGCLTPQTVSNAELEKAKAEWQEPKVSVWYYIGSKYGYHYYLHRDLPGDQLYRVSEKDLNQINQFTFTRNKAKWKVMPWGVGEIMARNRAQSQEDGN